MEFNGKEICMKQRIITAVCGVLLIVPIILYGRLPFTIVTYILASVALFELLRMNKAVQRHIITTISSYLFLWLYMFPVTKYSFLQLTFTKIQLISLFIVVLFVYIVLSKNNFTFREASFLLLATLFLATAFEHLMYTRHVGLAYFLFVLFNIWATDSGAYFIGRSLGKRKLWPEISPNKTVAGAVGGIVFACIVGAIFYVTNTIHFTFVQLIVLAIATSIIGQLGDLVASAIKRTFQIKDFGKLFPGHGGVLDRLDSVLFTFLVLSIIVIF